ncbi:MAG: RNA-binding S4 domain-containing protein [Rikenellaceae bacterium]|jgi:ribosome-associated heat shock protein Hsp15|nr:RNA-binding S4 domain-containing protein [Rikenellaceae bacterium]
MPTRIDKWLWAVRIYKTRTDATDACRNNRVTLNGNASKPSREVHAGDTVTVRKGPVTYALRVLVEIGNRQPARNVPLYLENLTPDSELDKLRMRDGVVFARRDRGTGRPTKKERRDIDGLIDGLFEDGDDE